jgi:hypothetical protein
MLGMACPHAGGCGFGLRPGRIPPVAGGRCGINGASLPLARAAARATQCLPLSLNLPIGSPSAVRRPISKKSDLRWGAITYPPYCRVRRRNPVSRAAIRAEEAPAPQRRPRGKTRIEGRTRADFPTWRRRGSHGW